MPDSGRMYENNYSLRRVVEIKFKSNKQITWPKKKSSKIDEFYTLEYYVNKNKMKIVFEIKENSVSYEEYMEFFDNLLKLRDFFTSPFLIK